MNQIKSNIERKKWSDAKQFIYVASSKYICIRKGTFFSISTAALLFDDSFVIVCFLFIILYFTFFPILPFSFHKHTLTHRQRIGNECV